MNKNKMKTIRNHRKLCCLFLFAFLCFLLPCTKAFAAEDPSGTCGDYLQWTFVQAKKELVITGYGEMDNFQFAIEDNTLTRIFQPWRSYDAEIEKVSLPEGLTHIGSAAFADCKHLYAISIPDTVTSIGVYAFYGTERLQSIEMSDNIQILAENAFTNCPKVFSVTIPEGVTNLDAYEFHGCKNISSISLPNSLTEIRDFVFSGLSSLDSISIPNGVTSIGDYAFWGCENLRSIILPNSVTSIGSYAFSHCTSLTAIGLPNSVTAIGYHAFQDSGYEKNTGNWSNGLLYLGHHLIETKDSPSFSQSQSIREGTKTIAENALAGLSKLTEITIPSSLTNIGAGAFSDCSNLESVSISDLDAWCRISFDDPDSNPMKYAKTIMLSHEKVESVIVPGDVKDLSYTFWNFKDLKNATVPDGVEILGDYAFSGCSQLCYAIIPNSVETIGKNAFENCSALEDIFFVGTEQQWNAVAVDNGNDRLQNIAIHFVSSPQDVCTISLIVPADCKAGLNHFVAAKGETITAFARADRIGYGLDQIFLDGNPIEGLSFTVTGNHTVTVTIKQYYDTSVGGTCGESLNWAITNGSTLHVFGRGEMDDFRYYSQTPWFAEPSRVSGIDIGSGVTKIGNWAFALLPGFTRIILPETVTEIGEETFAGSTDLTDVFYLGSEDTWNKIDVQTGNQTLTEANKHFLESVDQIFWLSTEPCEFGTVQLDKYFAVEDETVTVIATANSVGWAVAQICLNGEPIDGCSFRISRNSIVSAEFRKFYDTAIGGTVGEGVNWAITDGTILHIFGIGKWTDISPLKPQPWDAYRESITALEVSRGVTAIGEFACTDCYGLKSIVVPHTVNSIGYGAFTNCNQLKDVYFVGTEAQWNTVEKSSAYTQFFYATVHFISSTEDIFRLTVMPPQDGTLCLSQTITAKDETITVYANAAGIGYGVSQILVDGMPISGNQFCVTGNHTVSVCFQKYFDAEIGGSCGEGLNWAITEDRVLHIYGVGKMDCYETPPLIPWNEYSQIIQGLDIGNGVTSISDYAFEEMDNLQTALIPGSVTELGEGVFRFCDGLTIIRIPANVRQIGEAPFVYCPNLKEIEVSPDNPAYCAEDGVLFNAEKSILLQYPAGKAESSYSLPDTVITIAEQAFCACRNLKQLKLPTSVTDIGKAAFYSCTQLISIEIPSGIAALADDLFGDCDSLESILIPHSVAAIGDRVFNGCNELNDVFYCGSPEQWNAIPAGVLNERLSKATVHFATSPDNICFLSLTDPENGTAQLSRRIALKGETVFVTAIATAPGYFGVDQIFVDGVAIEGYSFTVCGNHTVSITFKEYFDASVGGSCGTNLNWAITEDNVLHLFGNGEMDDYMMSGSGAAPWYAYRQTILAVDLGEQVTKIGSYAFSNCNKVTLVTIPSSVRKISANAFYGCDALKDVFYIGAKTATIANPNPEIQTAAEHVVSSKTDVCTISVLPSENGTIQLSQMAAAKGETVQVVAKATKAGYYGVEQILVDGLPIEGDSFTVCGNHIVSVIFQKCYEAIDGGTCGDTLEWSITKDLVLHIYGSGAMDDYALDLWWQLAPWDSYRSSITAIEIGSGVTMIGKYAFSDCALVTNIFLPESVESIGDYAFRNCSLMNEINFPQKLQRIGTAAFYNCRKLNHITLPEKLTDLAEMLFDGCSALSDISIPNGIQSIGNSAFVGCTSLVTIVIPDTVTSLGTNAFYNCSKLTEIVIPENVKVIENYAFSGCSALKIVSLPNNLLRIGNYAFSSCKQLTELYVPAALTAIGNRAFDASNLQKIYYAGTSEQWELVGKGTSALPADISLYCNCLQKGIVRIEKQTLIAFDFTDAIQAKSSTVLVGIYADGRLAALAEANLTPDGACSAILDYELISLDQIEIKAFGIADTFAPLCEAKQVIE